MATKYLGMKTANDLAGAVVRLARPVKNGLGQMPAGATGIIDNAAGYVKDGKLRFLADKCSCCGLQFSVSGLSYSDFELVKPSGVEPENTFIADWKPPQWCKGLSKRTADGLVRRAKYENLEQVILDRKNKPDSHFTNISNFGSKCLAELDAWLRHNGLI